MQRVLSFEQTPPLAIPLRFFLTAPLFALAAALLLLWQGENALASRWAPATLALTHLMTLGFMGMTMIGALLQMLPVVLGIDIPRARATAIAVHGLLTAGTVALASGFLLTLPALLKLAITLLLLAFGSLFLAAVRGVWRSATDSPMFIAIRFALVALALAVGLGATAASTLIWPLSLPIMLVTDLHAAWGLLGWVGLLVVGVAYQVVPMFQVTPPYPQRIMRWLAKGVFLLLALWSAAVLLPSERENAASVTLAVLIAGTYAVFAIVTLYLLWQRKRPKADATTMFWRTALTSLIACAALWTSGVVFPQVAGAAAYPLLIGVLFIVGFGYSVINGMLYKIVPFLVWYHLQNQMVGGCAKAPNVKQVLPDTAAERQFRAHLCALLALVASTLHPEWVSTVAAVLFGTSSAWLWLNLMKAARMYRHLAPAKPALQDGAAS